MAMFTIKKLMGFSHGFRLVGNYSNDGVPSQRNKNNQAVRKVFPIFSAVRFQ